MLSEAKNQGSSNIPGFLGFIMGVERNGASFAAASGMVMVTDLRPATSLFLTVAELPLRLTYQENVSFLPNRL